MAETTPTSPSVGRYLIDRLVGLGVEHVFGIPGDYVLGLYKMLDESPLKLVGTTREDNAGFAADAYARVRGLGCVCVTYCVGGLSTANSIAGAFAEKSPVIVLSGSPGLGERERNPLLHHKVKTFETQFDVFQHLTVASAVLDRPEVAFAEIDRVLDAAVRYKRPVYLELPRDQIHVVPERVHHRRESVPTSDPEALREALDEAEAMLTSARRPVILADVEIHRFHLQAELMELAEAAGMPIATTILGKSVVAETHPLFAGIYEGAMGRPEITELVESSDCLLMLGCFLTDINLGIFTAKLDPSRCIDATSEDLRIRRHHYRDVRLDDFIRGLIARRLKVHRVPVPARTNPFGGVEIGPGDSPTTSAKVFARLNRLLTETSGTTVVADVGDSLFGATDLEMERHTEFLCPAYYTSMGFGLPAALGANVANPASRVLVIVGDGAFQMTGMELSTIARNGFNPIVVVLNNHGYTTERFMLDGPFNDVFGWAYHRIPDVLGTGLGIEVRTVAELDDAIARAWANTESFSLLNIHLDPYDHSPALERLASRMATLVDRKPQAP
ncbi:alpha-keto acid decarboxylase family protein [Planctomyces sp. SH-PL62]|uniref:alpha-keto acid decarboxylase family protein n=1 Tax=Planctomyces sp. SH-PL62 TaxID=1636152 RepID=UPI00078DC64C|nr:thiamine pyrophosphate-binding protein [Planctomyces sp. SH-PL62]AMV38996.1 Indole-3-pyruvate decarboxylase [Planctomyces sp. SH-PL62]